MDVTDSYNGNYMSVVFTVSVDLRMPPSDQGPIPHMVVRDLV